MPPDQAEATARIFDRLSEEIGEAAAMLRGATAPGTRSRASDPRPSCDPWSIVNTAIHDLARNGVKAHFGAEVDLATAVGGAATMLDALGVAPVVGDDDPMHPHTVTASVQRRALHECAECGGVGTAPTHRASCSQVTAAGAPGIASRPVR